MASCDKLNELFQQASNIINTNPDEIHGILMDATKKGYLEVVKYMIHQQGANGDYYDETPLHIASKEGHLEIVEYLIDDKNGVVNIDQRSYSKGLTPLHYAVLAGHTAVMKCLIDHGAEINALSKVGTTPLHLAVKSGHIEVAKVLLDSGADIDYPLSCTFDFNESGTDIGHPLYYAVENNDNEMSKCLIDHGADLNIRCPYNGNLPPLIHFAIELDNEEIVKHLIETDRTNIDQVTNEENLTPFELASSKKKYKIMALFLQKRADENEIKDTYQENKISDKDPCIICFRNRNGIYVFTPCGHASHCELCCVTLMSKNDDDSKQCPTCRKPIQDYMKVFFQ